MSGHHVERFRQANIAAAVIQLLQGSVLWGLVPAYGEQEWPLQNLGWASEVVWEHDYQLGWLVPAFPTLSALNHIYASTHSGATHILEAKENPVRWAEYAVTSSLMLWIIATLAGVLDVGVLSGLMLLNSCMILFGLVLEKMKKRGATHEQLKLPLLLVVGLFIGTWIPVLTSFQTVVDTTDGVPPAVYSIIWIQFLLFASFGVMQSMYLFDVVTYEQAELGFVGLSLSSKTLLAWLVYGGVLAADVRFGTPTPST